jgi:hypothetical protein
VPKLLEREKTSAPVSKPTPRKARKKGGKG